MPRYSGNKYDIAAKAKRGAIVTIVVYGRLYARRCDLVCKGSLSGCCERHDFGNDAVGDLVGEVASKNGFVQKIATVRRFVEQ